MKMAPSPPPLSDFHPPYRLGAFGCAVVGTWDCAPEPALDRGGFEPLRWRGRAVGAALVLRYDRPPAEHPAPYSEVIFAHLVRRGIELAVLPFDLVLDDPFFVEAGLRHYHLPKRLDASLKIDVERDATGREVRMTATGDGLAYAARLEPVTAPGIGPMASALMRGSTGRLPVIGAAGQPLLSALIQITPGARPAYAVREVTLASRTARLRPLGALYWPRLALTVGAPRPLARRTAPETK